MRSTADPRVEVFAVEPSAVELVVRSRYDGDHALSVGTRSALVSVRDGVGAAVLDGLEDDTDLRGGDRRPSGDEAPHIARPSRPVPRPLRHCLRHAHRGDRFRTCPPTPPVGGRQPRSSRRVPRGPCPSWPPGALRAWWSRAISPTTAAPRSTTSLGELLAASGLPLWAIPGNHDGGNHRHDDGAEHLARHQIVLHETTTAVELAGLQVVLEHRPSRTASTGSRRSTTPICSRCWDVDVPHCWCSTTS